MAEINQQYQYIKGIKLAGIADATPNLNVRGSVIMHAASLLEHPPQAVEGARPAASARRLDIAQLVHPSDWLRLPPSLRRRFEAGHGPAAYRGTMDFENSATGRVFARLARAFGAPLPAQRAAGAPVTVDVRAAGDGVAWSRQLGATQRVRSVKSAGPGGTVLERTDGGLGMVLDVSVADGALVFTSRRFFFAAGPWRVPIPAVLTPGRCRVEHRAVDDARFRFTLTMVHPLWGMTFRQTGLFTETPESLP